MGKGRGACGDLSTCDRVLVAFIVLGVFAVVLTGILIATNVLPGKHSEYETKDCHVEKVGAIWSTCGKCGRHGRGHGSHHGRGPHGGPGEHKDGPDSKPPKKPEGKPDSSDGKPEDFPDKPHMEPPEGGHMSRPEGGHMSRPEGGHMSRPEGGHMTHPEGGRMSLPEGGHMSPPKDGGAMVDPEGHGYPEPHGKPGMCPPIAAMLIHVKYNVGKTMRVGMLHSDLKSRKHYPKHSFADCSDHNDDDDDHDDFTWPEGEPSPHKPSPKPLQRRKRQAPPHDKPEPEKDHGSDESDHHDYRDRKGRWGPHHGPTGSTGRMHRDGSHKPTGRTPCPSTPDSDHKQVTDKPIPATATLPTTTIRAPILKEVRQFMSEKMHTVEALFTVMRTKAHTFPCYVHPEDQDHAIFTAPSEWGGRKWMCRHISYPVVAVVVLVTVFVIKKMCEAKKAKKCVDVDKKQMYAVENPNYAQPPVQPKASEAGVNEKDPEVLGPEVVPGGENFGSKTVLMSGPVAKEAEAYTPATPRALVADPFPPVDGDFRIDSPPPAYSNLPKY